MEYVFLMYQWAVNRWFELRSQIPKFDSDTDEIVSKYVRGIEQLVRWVFRASYYWMVSLKLKFFEADWSIGLLKRNAILVLNAAKWRIRWESQYYHWNRGLKNLSRNSNIPSSESYYMQRYGQQKVRKTKYRQGVETILSSTCLEMSWGACDILISMYK